MKKTLLSLTMALLATVAFGQIEQGTKFLGGTFGFSSGSSETTVAGQTSDGPERSMFEIAPSFGYMVSDNIGVGLRVGISSMTETETFTDFSDPLNPIEVEEEDQTSETAIGFFGRYYAPVAGDALFFHVDLGVDIGFGTETNTVSPAGGPSTETELDLNSLRIGLTPGFDYFLGEKWAIEANWGFLGYTSRGTETDNFESSSNSLDIGVDFTAFNVGARWYF